MMMLRSIFDGGTERSTYLRLIVRIGGSCCCSKSTQKRQDLTIDTSALLVENGVRVTDSIHAVLPASAAANGAGQSRDRSPLGPLNVDLVFLPPNEYHEATTRSQEPSHRKGSDLSFPRL